MSPEPEGRGASRRARVRARDRILGFVASSRRIVVVARWKVWNCVAGAVSNVAVQGCSHTNHHFRILILAGLRAPAAARATNGTTKAGVAADLSTDL